MKKVLFLQNKGKTYGGVWYINRLVGEELLKNGYEVHIVSIRDGKTDLVLEHHKDLVVKTINEKDEWETYHLSDILGAFKKGHLVSVGKMIIAKLKYNVSLKQDIRKLYEYINKYNPDYIVTSHYQLISMIPKNYLDRTIHEQHSSFEDAINHRATRETMDKYRNKIKFLWLTKETRDRAIARGYTDSGYIYNAVRFKSKEKAEVTKNKKLVTISRLAEDKSIDKMIEIAASVFKDSKYKDWSLEIYGTGDLEEELEKQIVNKKQIKLMGVTKDPKKVLLTSSINLNTSKYEGFSLSILEANECGVPTIAFNFGESTPEQILNDKTGIIAKDMEDYKNRLKELMENSQKLEELSINAREFSKEFQIEKIITSWIDLFDLVDESRNG